jgi:hypothetical protein
VGSIPVGSIPVGSIPVGGVCPTRGMMRGCSHPPRATMHIYRC